MNNNKKSRLDILSHKVDAKKKVLFGLAILMLLGAVVIVMPNSFIYGTQTSRSDAGIKVKETAHKPEKPAKPTNPVEQKDEVVDFDDEDEVTDVPVLSLQDSQLPETSATVKTGLKVLGGIFFATTGFALLTVAKGKD
ncbi:hypothetical protein EFL45_00565 [Weissella confusa]|uniref:hypothetical protein n=1 Tax=Weissella confusa TaxID=1583 RepID=UPI00223BB7FA|nr:hypothetical protein [Weissella confusa]MCT0947965.1 hypothetical protein [Weissella confusa]